MLPLVRVAIRVATAWLLLVGIPAFGVEFVHEESRLPAYDDREESSETLGQEQMLSPSIDITSDRFVSNLPTTHWGFATELLILHTEYGSVDFSDEGGGDKAAAGLRLTLGWESDAGYGIRTRLSGVGIEGSTDHISFQGHDSAEDPVFEGFDYRGVSPTAESSSPLRLVTATWDVDFYKRLVRGRSDLVVGAGLRSAVIHSEAPIAITNTINTGGVSLFSELRHVMYHSERSEVALVGGGRVSFLTGEWESKIPSDMIEVDTDMTITEGALGLEWSRILGRSVLTLRAQYETQLWNSDVTSDVSFNGGVIRAGVNW